MNEKEEKRQPVPWEAKDPKPPVINCGRMEEKREH